MKHTTYFWILKAEIPKQYKVLRALLVNLACGRGSSSEHWSRMNILQESFPRDNGGWGIAKPTCFSTKAVPKREEQSAKKPKICELNMNRTSGLVYMANPPKSWKKACAYIEIIFWILCTWNKKECVGSFQRS